MKAATTGEAACDIEWGIANESSASLHIRYPPGELIYQAETYAAGIYIIVCGLVSDHHAMQSGGHRSPVLEILGPGDLIGLDTLLERPANLHLTSARAITEVALRFFERDVFQQILCDQPAVCRRYLDYLNYRFHALKKSTSPAIVSSSEARLCSLLLRLAQRFGEPHESGSTLLPTGISTERLPELLGISRRRVRNILACLPEVRQAGERLIISVEALQRWLAGDRGPAPIHPRAFPR